MANTENLFQRLWGRFIGYRLGGGGGFMSTMEIPPSWNYEQYLQVYGQVGWLFGVVNVISSSVAEVPWRLMKVKGGKAEEVANHPMMDMWDYVNPFQTRYQFMQLLEMYVLLVGEAFIVINFNARNVPAEMWLAPPQFMKIVPSADRYIDHYTYTRGGASLRLEIPEVVHIMSPNPANPYRGLGATHSIGTDLSTEMYAARFNNRVFYNDATPALFLEYPEMPPKEERKEIMEAWNKTYRGWQNARKTGFLWGGAKANAVTMTNKDMEYWRLRKLTADIVLGAYHVPKSIMGMAEVGSRARAEADEYIFAKRVVKPELTRVKEALTEQLVPLFGDDTLEFEFEDPVPENREAKVLEAKDLVTAGIVTREEAREHLGYDREADGTFLLPMATLEIPAKIFGGNGAKPMMPVAREVDQKEVAWRKYVMRNADYEEKFMSDFREVWYDQQGVVIDLLHRGAASPDKVLFDEAAQSQIFADKLEPVITETFVAAAEAAEAEIAEANKAVIPVTVYYHRGGDGILQKQGVLNEEALHWLATESLNMAKLVNGTTIKELRAVLAKLFEEGASIPKIEKGIRQYYRNGYQKRGMLVARTETIAASNEGSLQVYEANRVEQAEFYAALDERTCEECMDYHGRVFATTDAHGLIPVHPQCRCTWVPVV